MLGLRSAGKNNHPAVLFLHGFMGRANDWWPVIEEMQAAYHCLAVDLPGHGSSTARSEEAYTMENTAQAVLDVLDREGIAQGAIVGYSMGGRLALYLAVHFPERCRLLVLESASPGLATEEERAARRVVDESRARRLEREDLDTFLDDWYRQPLFASLAGHEGLVEALIARRCANDRRALARSLRGMGTGRQPSLWEELGALQVPTVALAGALDARYVSLARQMADRSRLIHVDIVEAAGHNIHVEQPQRYITRLHSYLKQT